MASSMVPGERRWTSTRKSGMTVLGKVPKPINLPSQKLENHGLDPNVEIVPKGTLTWGSRPLAASNAWGSSTLSSPRADGNVNSPVFANGRPSSGGSGTRPSSGGSGTRPSTGGSERSNEPAASSWGPSSRPSSATGILPTCHISMAANRPQSAETRSSITKRPQSAETRSNSSQLSRFSESSADNAAWGAAGTSGIFAAEAFRRRDFTLSSGDFPTLGSEKSCELKLLQGHSTNIPSFASGLPSTQEGILEPLLTSGNGNPGQALHGTFNSWSADSDPHTGKGSSTRSENWHMDYHNEQPQLNANMPPQQFVSWHGHPVHPPNGVWYGVHGAGGPYRLPGPLQSYHVGPYSPYPTAGGIPNAEAFPRPEAIPGRVQLKNGEAYSYMPPESYIAHSQSVIPVRPGIYPDPVLYKGCYGLPCASSDRSSEQDGSTKGTPRQYGVHNPHPSDNLRLELQSFHAQADGFDAVRTKEQMVSGHSNEIQEQYNVLLKQHDSREDKEALESGNQPGFSAPEAGLLDNSYKQEQTTGRQHCGVAQSQHVDDLVDPNIENSLETSKVAGDDVSKKPVTATEWVSDVQHNPFIIKNASLMEKVEGLNSKARVAEVHTEGENLPTKEKIKSIRSSIINAEHFKKAGLANASSANNSISGSSNAIDCQFTTSTKDSAHQSVINLRLAPVQSVEQIHVPDKSNYSKDGGHSQPHNQKRVRDIKANVDHSHEKLKFGSYGVDEMTSITQRHSLENINMASGKNGCELSMPGLCASQVAPSDQSSRIILKSGSYPSTLESIDPDIQHTKPKELARQRAIQLQKEEEQRSMEQKAKALTKLNELNKGTSESSKHNLSHPQPLCNDSLNEHDTASGKDAEANTIVIEAPCGSLSCDFEVQKQANDDNNVKKLEDPADFSSNESSRTSESTFQVSGTLHEQSLSSQKIAPVIITGRAASNSQDSNVSKRKQAGYRRKRNVKDERSQSEKLTNFENFGNKKCVSMATEDFTNSLGNLNNEDPNVLARNKNNSGPKYKNKLIVFQPNSPLPASTHPEGTSKKFDLESDETKPLATGVEAIPISEKISDDTAGGLGIGSRVPPNQAGSETSKATFGRASNNWKPHPHRKPARNLQSDKTNTKYQGSETVVWAPVKLVCKNESSVEACKSSASGITDLPDGKIGLDIHSGAKAKRAEMERYVPKPIAKELSLHGGSPLSSALSALIPFADVSGELDLASASALTARDRSSAAKPALAYENRNIKNTKQNMHGKPHASWRQRNLGESESHKESAVEGGLSSETPKCVEKTSELHPSVPSGDWRVGGCNGMRDEPTAVLGVIKNNSMSRQRGQQFKVQQADKSSYSPPHSNVLQGEEPDESKIQSKVPDDSGETYFSRIENQNAGSDHMKSHWKPKSRIHPQHSAHDYKDSGGQRAADKLLPSQATENLDDSGALGQVNNMIEVNDRKSRGGYWEGKVMTNSMKYQEGTRERKVMTQPSKCLNQSLDQDLAIQTESTAAIADSHHEHFGARGHGQYHGRFPRVRNAAHGGSQRVHSSGQVRDDCQNFEYQKPEKYEPGDIFQQNSGASEEASEVHRVLSGARYGEQGRNHTRHSGHFHGPRRGPGVRVSGAYNN